MRKIYFSCFSKRIYKERMHLRLWFFFFFWLNNSHGVILPLFFSKCLRVCLYIPFIYGVDMLCMSSLISSRELASNSSRMHTPSGKFVSSAFSSSQYMSAPTFIILSFSRSKCRSVYRLIVSLSSVTVLGAIILCGYSFLQSLTII